MVTEILYQMYTMFNHIFLLVYTLTVKKVEYTYNIIFQAIVNLCFTENLVLQPTIFN